MVVCAEDLQDALVTEEEGAITDYDQLRFAKTQEVLENEKKEIDALKASHRKLSGLEKDELRPAVWP
jgi:hypothetical protein